MMFLGPASDIVRRECPMAQMGSFALLLTLVLSGYRFVAGIVALVGGRTQNESEEQPDARVRCRLAPRWDDTGLPAGRAR